jgi:glycosyltransferase involved in cell wall biosynthesis
VISGFNGYICPSNTKQFADHIRELLDNENEYLRLAHNCLILRHVLSFERWTTELTRHLAARGIIPTGLDLQVPLLSICTQPLPTV